MVLGLATNRRLRVPSVAWGCGRRGRGFSRLEPAVARLQPCLSLRIGRAGLTPGMRKAAVSTFADREFGPARPLITATKCKRISAGDGGDRLPHRATPSYSRVGPSSDLALSPSV